MLRLKVQIAFLAACLVAALVAKHYVDRFLNGQGASSVSSAPEHQDASVLEVQAPEVGQSLSPADAADATPVGSSGTVAAKP